MNTIDCSSSSSEMTTSNNELSSNKRNYNWGVSVTVVVFSISLNVLTTTTSCLILYLSSFSCFLHRKHILLALGVVLVAGISMWELRIKRRMRMKICFGVWRNWKLLLFMSSVIIFNFIGSNVALINELSFLTLIYLIFIVTININSMGH